MRMWLVPLLFAGILWITFTENTRPVLQQIDLLTFIISPVLSLSLNTELTLVQNGAPSELNAETCYYSVLRFDSFMRPTSTWSPSKIKVKLGRDTGLDGVSHWNFYYLHQLLVSTLILMMNFLQRWLTHDGWKTLDDALTGNNAGRRATGSIWSRAVMDNCAQ